MLPSIAAATTSVSTHRLAVFFASDRAFFVSFSMFAPLSLIFDDV